MSPTYNENDRVAAESSERAARARMSKHDGMRVFLCGVCFQRKNPSMPMPAAALGTEGHNCIVCRSPIYVLDALYEIDPEEYEDKVIQDLCRKQKMRAAARKLMTPEQRQFNETENDVAMCQNCFDIGNHSEELPPEIEDAERSRVCMLCGSINHRLFETSFLDFCKSHKAKAAQRARMRNHDTSDLSEEKFSLCDDCFEKAATKLDETEHGEPIDGPCILCRNSPSYQITLASAVKLIHALKPDNHYFRSTIRRGYHRAIGFHRDATYGEYQHQTGAKCESLIATPQVLFKPEGFVLFDVPPECMLADVRVGNISEFASADPIPARFYEMHLRRRESGPQIVESLEDAVGVTGNIAQETMQEALEVMGASEEPPSPALVKELKKLEPPESGDLLEIPEFFAVSWQTLEIGNILRLLFTGGLPGHAVVIGRTAS